MKKKNKKTKKKKDPIKTLMDLNLSVLDKRKRK